MERLLSKMASPKTLATGIGLSLALLVVGMLSHSSAPLVQLIRLALKLLALFNLVVGLTMLARLGQTRRRILDALSPLLRHLDDHHSKQN